MHARALDEASGRLRQFRWGIRDSAVLAGVTALFASGLAPVSTPIAGALAVAALVEATMLGVRLLRRRLLLEQLALVPAAYEIPEVAGYGRRVTGRRQRERTADALRRMIVGGAGRPVLWLPERVTALETELRGVYDALRAADSGVQPPAVVACRQLVTNPVRSGLYNPNLPIEEVRARLQGITRTLAADQESA
jgi:hypothetical protein